MSEVRRLAIFCGSSPGARPEYVKGARAFGAMLANRGIAVVYGGSSVGLMSAIAESVLDGDILSFDVAQLTHSLPECLVLDRGSGAGRQIPYPGGLRRRRLCLTRERRGQRPKREPAEERAPVHYSMISSARTNRDWGIVSPRAFAVFKLMTSSNFVGCSTGRSAGLAPFRILST